MDGRTRRSRTGLPFLGNATGLTRGNLLVRRIFEPAVTVIGPDIVVRTTSQGPWAGRAPAQVTAPLKRIQRLVKLRNEQA